MTSSNWNDLHRTDPSYDLTLQRGDIDGLVEVLLHNFAQISPQFPCTKSDERLHVADEMSGLMRGLFSAMGARDPRRTGFILGSIIVAAIKAGHRFDLPMDCIVRELAGDGDMDQCFRI